MWDIIRANRRKSAILIVVLGAVLMLMGYAVGILVDPQFGSFGVVAAMVIWVAMLMTAMAGGERILLAQANAREVSRKDAPQLFNIVEEMQIAAGIHQTPRVFIIASPIPNAFAVGRNPNRAAVAVTTGLMSRLNRDELQGVVAHEIAHIANRDTLFMTLAGVTVGAVIILADFTARSMFYGRRGRGRSSGGGQAAAIVAIVAVLMAVLAPLLAQLLYFACSRRREYLADASAAQFTRYPEGLASALEKISQSQGAQIETSRVLAPMYIVNPLAARGRSRGWMSTHPPTEDRIRVLRGMAKNSSLAAYEAAYRALHHNRGVLGAAAVKQSADAPSREPSGATTAAMGWRETKEVLHKLDHLTALSCGCGMRFRLPPDFDRPVITCPKCAARHEVPREELAAAAALGRMGGGGRV